MIDFKKLTSEQAEIITDALRIIKPDFKEIINKREDMISWCEERELQAFKELYTREKDLIIKLYELVYNDDYKNLYKIL